MPVRSWARNEIVQLNVGGQKFSTTVDTLTKEKDSMLGVWFSGRHDVMFDAEGRVFIDRDGFRFRHILNFLRNGSVHISGDIVTYQEVLEEAQFFGIGTLEERLLEEMKKLESPDPEENTENVILSQSSESGPVLLTGSWLLQQHQLKNPQTSVASEGHDDTYDDASFVTASQQTEYRFSLDEDF